MAQRFTIDNLPSSGAQLVGSLCIPYILGAPNKSPTPGRINLIGQSNGDLTTITELRVSLTSLQGNQIGAFLTGSQSGKIALYKKTNATRYSVFRYYNSTGIGPDTTGYASYQIESGSVGSGINVGALMFNPHLLLIT